MKPLISALLIALLAGCSSTPASVSPAQSAQVSSVSGSTAVCTLRKTPSQYEGSCEIPCQVNELAVNFDGTKRGFTCAEPARKVAASLRQTSTSGYWLGEMQGRQVEDPTRFEVITAASGVRNGVAKLPFGWFPLVDAKNDGESFVLTMVVDKQLPPTTDDVKIVQRAEQILASTAVWNKNDDRNCPPNPQKYSLFCALIQATAEVSGGYHYRQPAMQTVREVLNEVGGTRMGKHRLMDYNNHVDTTLQDVHNLLRTAQQRIQRDIR